MLFPGLFPLEILNGGAPFTGNHVASRFVASLPFSSVVLSTARTRVFLTSLAGAIHENTECGSCSTSCLVGQVLTEPQLRAKPKGTGPSRPGPVFFSLSQYGADRVEQLLSGKRLGERTMGAKRAGLGQQVYVASLGPTRDR